MVSKFRNLEQVVYEPRHYRADFGFVVISERQFLQMREKFRAHVALNTHAHDVSPVNDKVIQRGFEQENPEQNRRKSKNVIELFDLDDFARDFRVSKV